MLLFQHAIYKGAAGRGGAIQFTPSRPYYYKNNERDYKREKAFDSSGKRNTGWKERAGCVFMEVAPAVGKNEYDWKQKITMALSTTDLGKLLYFITFGKSSSKNERERDGQPTNSMTLMHDPGAQTDTAGQIKKYLRLYSPGGTAEGCMLTIVQMKGKEKLEHKVGISGDELIVLRTLFQTAITNTLSWS